MQNGTLQLRQSYQVLVTGLLVALHLSQHSSILSGFGEIPSTATNMAAAVNKSFASPAANADYPVALHDVAEGLLARVYNGVNGTSLVFTVLLLLVAYDQCALLLSKFAQTTNHIPSQLYME